MDHSVGSPTLWIGFLLFVAFTVALDLGVLRRKAREVGFKEAMIWTIGWIVVALLFAVPMYMWFGREAAANYLTGYVIERALSIDNIFVFILVFSGFAVPAAYQHRVLVWGIIGAVLLRGVCIFLGAEIVARFHAVLYVFGVILAYTGGKMFYEQFFVEKHEEEKNIEDNRSVKLFRRFVPTTDGYRGMHFFVTEDGKWKATPLFLVLCTIEVSDLVFAADSIPAIFAVTTDPFIVFSSNIFAILGLRSMYFVLAAILPLFRFLEVGVSLVLLFIAVKILLPATAYFTGGAPLHISSEISLAIVFGILAGSMVLSRVIPKPKEAADEPEKGEPGLGEPTLNHTIPEAEKSEA